MSTLQAIPTQHGIDILNSELKNTVTKYRLIGALTHVGVLTHDEPSESLYSFYENTIETSYYDENGVLTFILNLPIEQHFEEYLHQIHVLDSSNQSVIECSTPKVALPKGIGGMVTLKAAISGEAGQVIFKHSEFVTEAELVELHLTQYAKKTELEQVEQRSLLTAKDFVKSSSWEPAFNIAGGVVRTACDIAVIVGDRVVTAGANEIIDTPTMVIGVDYAIYATHDGLLVSSNFTVPSGYTESNSRRIGGFHYGNNEFKTHSFYDLHLRPRARDPRGMVLDVGERFWADIYLTNTTPNLLGTSAYNAQIADGSSPPKVPPQLGGDGVQQYTNYSQFAANELLACYGKRLPNYQEFQMVARGSVSGYARGSDPVKTLFDSSARSIIGCEQVSGNVWQWGSEVWDRGNGTSGYSWHNIAEGYGQMYAAHSQAVGASLFGGDWGVSGRAGSRASHWNHEPSHSISAISSRGVCDPLILV